MFGLEQVKAGRFGKMQSNNILEAALKVKNEKYNRKEEDERIIVQLYSLISHLKAKENRLYKDLGFKGSNLDDNFKKFVSLWQGNNISSNEDEDRFWLNEHLNFLIGQTQRLATGKGFTFIEQLMELVAIELDDPTFVTTTYGGLSNKEKQKLKQISATIEDPETQENILQEITKNTKWKKEAHLFVPTKKKGKTRKQDDMMLLIEEYFREKANTLGGDIANNGYLLIANAIYDIRDKKMSNELVYKTHTGKNLSTVTNNIDTLFVEFNFRSAYLHGNINQAKEVWKELERFFISARSLTWTPEHKEAWNMYVQNGGAKTFKSKFLDLLIYFFKNTKTFRPETFLSTENAVMGFFGELYTYGKSYFNLKNFNQDISLLWTGSLLNKSGNKQLAYDMVLSVKGNQYGFQVKNPYKTENGVYETYKDTFDFSESRLYENYLEITDPYAIECFKQLNLNLNTPTSSTTLEHALESFLYLYSQNFIRLKSEEIKSSNLTKEVKEELSKSNFTARNIFFVLRGEIIPSRTVLQGLLNQYRYFLDKTQTKPDINTIKLKYNNEIEPTEVPVENATREVQMEYVVAGAEAENLLKKIKLSTSLNLTIPSIKELEKLRW